MKEKIKQYVDHYFRFDQRSDLESLKQEIIANLSDKYDAMVEAGKDPQQAYIDTIKSMGDFNPQMDDKVSPEFNELPAWPEYSLPSSAILSIFAVIFIFFNTLLGGISTAVSIILYAVGSYYLYAKAMHVKSAQLDIELHKTYLAKIFTYMKTAFVFWSLNLSYILALIAQSVLTRVILWFRPSIESDPRELKNFMDTTLIASIVLFFVALILLLLLSYVIYRKLLTKYVLLTGEPNLKGKVKTSLDYLNVEATYGNSEKWLLGFLYVFGLVPILLMPFWDIYDQGRLIVWFFQTGIIEFPFMTIFILLSYISLIGLFVVYHIKKIHYNFLVIGIISFVLLHIYIQVSLVHFNLDITEWYTILILMVSASIMTIYLLIQVFRLKKKQQLKAFCQKYLSMRLMWIILSILPIILYLGTPLEIVYLNESNVEINREFGFLSEQLRNMFGSSFFGSLSVISIIINLFIVSPLVILNVIKKKIIWIVNLITLIVLLPTPSTDSSIIIYPLSNREWIVIIIACLSTILYWIWSSRKPIVKEVK